MLSHRTLRSYLVQMSLRGQASAVVDPGGSRRAGGGGGGGGGGEAPAALLCVCVAECIGVLKSVVTKILFPLTMPVITPRAHAQRGVK